MTSKDLKSCFSTLVEGNYARWMGIARAYAETSQREDLLQEIMLQIWKSLDNFQARSSIDTWAYRIALNTALAWQRTSKNRAVKLKTSVSEVGQLEGAVKSEGLELKILDEFLASLSKTDRAVMLLFLDGVSNPEAAEIMGMTEGTLRVRLHRIRKQFEQAYCNGGSNHDI